MDDLLKLARNADPDQLAVALEGLASDRPDAAQTTESGFRRRGPANGSGQE